MITAVDTNVLLDIFLDDSEFSEKSSDMLRKCIREGKVIACDRFSNSIPCETPS